MQTGVRSGILLAVLGLWVILRATHKDSATGRTLINHILGTGGTQTADAGALSSPAAAAASAKATAAARNKARVPYGITHPVAPLTPPAAKVTNPLTTTP